MLHPGVNVALARLTMNELDIARAMRDGELTSPQQYENIWLFAIRITATGLSYRTARKEYVWRDSSLYLTQEFLDRCNGLVVTWLHPPTDTLTSKEFETRAIGSVLLPYIKGEEVWGIAKIYDDESALEMTEKQLSTSPTVVLRDVGNTVLSTESGIPLLIEGEPKLLDAIAVVPNGVWDKGGAATGVLNETLGNKRADSMTEEETKAADAKRRADDDMAADAKRRADAAAEAPDRMLAAMNDAMARMDAFTKRMDAEESRRADAERKDRAEADAARCADDDDDDKFKKRMDAEEGEDREGLKKAGETEETAADKAKKRRADKETWRADRRGRADAQRRADAVKGDEDAKRRADAEEAARKADAARADADDAAAKKRADSIDMEAIRKALANTAMRSDAPNYAAMADAQSRADAQAYIPLGMKAPAPMQGEAEIDYSARLLRGVQKHSKAWGAVDLHTLQPAALAVAEGQIYADAASAARSAVDVPDGEMRAVQTIDPNSGHRITEFRGRTTIFKMNAPPPAAITKFHTERRA